MEHVITTELHIHVSAAQDIPAKTVNVIDVMLGRVHIMVRVKTDKIPTHVSVALVIRDVIVNTPTVQEINVIMVQHVSMETLTMLVNVLVVL